MIKKKTLEKLQQVITKLLSEIEEPVKIHPGFGETMDLNRLLRDPDYALNIFDGADYSLVDEFGHPYVTFENVKMKFMANKSGVINAQTYKSTAAKGRSFYSIEPLYIHIVKNGHHVWTDRTGRRYEIIENRITTADPGDISIKFYH